MAEGFVLNIPKEMLDRLQKADEKIEKLDKNSRRVGENIRLAFMEGAKGVDKFIGSLNSAQKILDGFKDKKINVGLNLDAKAIDDLKKQLSTAGVNIPVGVTGTGGNVPNMQSYLDSIVKITESLATMVNNLPKTTSRSNASNKGETSIPKTNEELIKSVNLWQTLQKEVDKYNQELDKVNKEIKRVEEIRKNIASGKGGIYNPKEHQENINRAKDLQDLINKHQAEQKAIIEKNKALAETFNRQKELKNVGTQQQDIELLRLNEDLTKQEQQALELEKQRTKELKEYEKLLIRIAQLKQEQDKVTKIQNTSTDSNVQVQAQQQQQRIQQLLTQANLRRVELENKLGNDVLQAQHKAGAKELEYLRKKENEKLKEADKALKELMSKTKRWQQQQDRDQIAFYNTRQGALQYSQNAKTINEQIKALNYLRTAQKSLDVSTSQGKKQFYELEREIKKTENALRRYGVQLGGVREQSSHLFNISQQLGRALSLMFSVSQIGQYISKMVNVRKEMELQQRSLQVLLQSKDKANELWNQTLDLAVKSPFRVKELVTYTKQLAAYRIESDKLFETNKMLADVSAGLGVDMQRLILAFGQVKSASFLRGTELRQFTEAGIPMLEELSKYFEELYGRSVSVAEVFDMISKRMVTFTDVENVFQRMTSAGGVFFNMQEELSQTTAGMISNLQDSIDLMFNEIGKKNQGIINTAIKWARGLVDNWETIGMVMKGTLVILASYKALTIDWGKVLDGISNKFKDLGTNILTNSKGNLIAGSIMIIVTALLAAARAYQKYRAGINEAIDAHAKFTDSINKLSVDFNRLEIDKQSKDIEEYKDKLSQLVGIAQQQYSIEVDFVVNDLQSIDEVKRKFNELKEQIMSFNNFSLAFDIEFAEQERIGRGDGLGRGISRDIEKLSDAQKKLVPYFTDVNKILSSMMSTTHNLTEEQQKFVDAFKSQGETESAAAFFNRQKEGLELLSKEYDKFFKQYTSKDSDAKWYENAPAYAIRKIQEIYNIDYGSLSRDLGDYYKYLNKVAQEQENLFTNIAGNLETRIAEAREQALKNNKEFTLGDEVKIAESLIKNSIDAKATAEEWAEEVRYEFYKAANEYFENEYFGFNIIPEIKPREEKGLEAWQIAFNKEVDEIVKNIEEDKDKSIFLPLKITTDTTTQQKQLATINDALDEAQKEINRLEIQKANLDADLRQNKITQEQYNALYTANIDKQKQYIEYMTYLRNLLGGDDEKGKGRGNAEEIKNRIELLRKLYDEYQKLSKSGSATEAYDKVVAGFGKATKELGLGDIKNIDFTNMAGILDTLKKVEQEAKRVGGDTYELFLKTFGEFDAEISLALNIKKKEKLESEINDMFSDYEMTIDLKKLDIPQNLAEDLFDVKWTDLDDIKQRLEQERNSLNEENQSIEKKIADAYKNKVSEETIEALKLQARGNKERIADIDKFYEKWNDIERKSTEERLKTYYKYLLNEQHERVKIRLETLRKLQEVEATSKYTDAQKETITDKLKEEENQALAKQTWKDFEASPMYMQLFDDIENMSKGALEQMIVTMGGLKTELQSMGLPASDLKEILSQINKVEEELERRNPFKDFTKNAKIAFNRSKELARLEEQRKSQQKDYNQVKLEYNSNQDLLATSQDYLSTLEVGSEEYDTQLSYVEILQRRVNELEKRLKGITDSVSETNNQINNINDSSNDFYEQLKNIGSITKSVVDGVFQITDAMSWLPEETQLSLERMKGLSDSAFTIASGIGSIMSGDIMGGITSLVSGVSGLVSLFMEWSSGAKEAAIETERQGRLLTDLQNKYDRLNKAIDEAWNIAQIKQYNAELQKNLQLQIIAQKSIIEAQKSVKGANDYGSEQWSAVKEAEEELQNLYDTQEELQKNIYSKLTGGIMDDVLSTTESFVDAWYDAFKETGDGLKGLEDNFNEMLLNLVKRQAAMKIAGRFIDEWDKALERYASDGDLSNSEIEYYANKVKNDLPALSSQLETFFSSFDNVIGDVSGNLSGLTKGIQGITESQADILASYLNSIRFIVSDSNSQLKALLAAQTSTSASNPIVAQLQVIAQQASAINTLLNTLVKGGHGLGGNGLKVFI